MFREKEIMDLGLKDKLVLITASSKGLGKATALEFAKEGATVIITSRNEENLKKTALEIKNITHANVSYYLCDLTKAEDIDNLFNNIAKQFNGVDILINNTGGPKFGNFDNITDKDWQAAFDLILLSMVRCIRNALPYMRKQHFGRIINFASSSFKEPIKNLILSNTFRTGILGLAKSLAIELAPFNILINTIGPGRILTERVEELDLEFAKKSGLLHDEVRKKFIESIPLGRYGTPDELARVALFLGSSANTFMTGQAILVDGGLVKSI
jgi:3-oxoacyl-[acyl-carrier protein] reductase